MPANKKLLELFYDVVSPYSLFAFEILHRYKLRWNIELKLKPFFLGGIMQGSGNKPPALVPNKGVYMTKDLQRLSKYFDIPVRQPANFVDMAITKGTLQTMRFVTAIDLKQPQFTERLSRELWHRLWQQDVDATEPSSLKEAALKAGISESVIADALLYMKHEDVKSRLKAYTDEALDLGAFGAPFIVAHVDGKKETIWGSDRFPILALIIGEKWEGPVPGVKSYL